MATKTYVMSSCVIWMASVKVVVVHKSLLRDTIVVQLCSSVITAHEPLTQSMK